MTMWRWQNHNFNVLSGWLLYSNVHPVRQSLAYLHTNILMPSCYLSNYFRSSFSLYTFYHILRRDQKVNTWALGSKGGTDLARLQLLVTGSPSISFLLLWQPICLSGKQSWNSWCGLALLTGISSSLVAFIRCLWRWISKERFWGV